MNEHETQMSRDDLESVAAKFQAFAEGLSSGEQAALRAILTCRTAEGTADGDMQGYDWGITFLPGVLDWHVSFSAGAPPKVTQWGGTYARDHRR